MTEEQSIEKRMKPGERQVAPTLDGIRKDHVERYRWAAERLKGLTVVDVGCGVGYGSQLLAEAGCRVKAADCDELAIQYARQHYAHDKVAYVAVRADNLGPFTLTDAAVVFELVEHLEDPLPMLKRLATYTRTLLVSTPNELVFPYRNYAYHHRHYTPEQFCHLLADAGWTVDEWWGQAGPESEPERDTQGRTLIANCSRSERPNREAWKTLPAPPPLAGPESVAIVAMGKSAGTYVNICAAKGDRKILFDQTWAINSMGAVIQHDLLFHMDDCRVQESRAAAEPNGNVAGLMRWLRRHPRFFTSKAYPEYAGAIEFPLQAVIDNVGTSYFNNTVAFAVGYALLVGAKKLGLFGCDYSYANLHKAERGRGCVEFLLGLAAARGVALEVAHDSSLLDANVSDRERLYGYDAYDVSFERSEGRILVRKQERETLPSAAEIERRYCHVPAGASGQRMAEPKKEEAA